MKKPDLAEKVQKKIAQINEANKSIKAILPEKDWEQRLQNSTNILEENYLQGKTTAPLLGAFLGVKDTFFVPDMPTRAGSWLPEGIFTGSPSIAVAQLTNAGALLVGKTTCSEFNYLNKSATQNPKAPDRSPGGSSSGSAAAVAAGFCDLALGSQSRGGIIIPAAFCGVFGYKPSSGRISNLGMLSFTPTLEQSGLFSSSLSLLKTAANILLNPNTKRQENGSLQTIGIPSQHYLSQIDAEVYAYYEVLLARLTSQGYKLVRLEILEDYLQLNRLHHNLFAAEFALQHLPYYQQHQYLYSLSARQLFEAGLAVAPDSIYEAREMQQAMREEAETIMEAQGVSLFLTPSTACLPPVFGNTIVPTSVNLPFSFLGLPCLSVPVQNHPSGLPFGLQISSLWGSDEFLLGSAEALIQALQQKSD